MLRTRVGYAGGQKKNPSYYNLGDHTETVQVDYDPSQTSYARLLAVFWATPNRCALDGDRQYMSAIFYHNDRRRSWPSKPVIASPARGVPASPQRSSRPRHFTWQRITTRSTFSAKRRA